MPYLGEIRLFAGSFAPVDWYVCDGRLVSIAENEALFNLLGTTYGGDGVDTFGLPDLRGRVPVHQGNGRVLGELGGTETVQLTLAQLSSHAHGMTAVSGPATTRSPAGAYLAEPARDLYAMSGTPQGYDTSAPAGSTQPHENMMPFLTINFIICGAGTVPSPI